MNQTTSSRLPQHYKLPSYVYRRTTGPPPSVRTFPIPRHYPIPDSDREVFRFVVAARKKTNKGVTEVDDEDNFWVSSVDTQPRSQGNVYFRKRFFYVNAAFTCGETRKRKRWRDKRGQVRNEHGPWSCCRVYFPFVWPYFKLDCTPSNEYRSGECHGCKRCANDYRIRVDGIKKYAFTNVNVCVWMEP